MWSNGYLDSSIWLVNSLGKLLYSNTTKTIIFCINVFLVTGFFLGFKEIYKILETVLIILIIYLLLLLLLLILAVLWTLLIMFKVQKTLPFLLFPAVTELIEHMHAKTCSENNRKNRRNWQQKPASCIF